MGKHCAEHAPAVSSPEMHLPPILLHEEQLILGIGRTTYFSMQERRYTILGRHPFSIGAALDELNSVERANALRSQIDDDLELVRRELRTFSNAEQHEMQPWWDHIAHEVFRSRHSRPTSLKRPEQTWANWLADRASAEELMEFVAQHEIRVEGYFAAQLPDLPPVDPELARLNQDLGVL